MVFDFRKFIEGGGSKTITDPAEQQRVFREAVEESRRSSRGGGGSSRRGGGGSSGGGGISAAEVERRQQAEIARQAELKRQQAEIARQAELKRQQEEARKLRDQIKEGKEQKAQSQTISGQVNIKEDKKGFNESFGTIQNQGINNVPFNAQVYTSPTIEERTTGSFVADGKTIPTTSFFLIEPPKYGSGGGAVKETKVFPSSITPSGAVFSIEGYEDVTIEKEHIAGGEPRTLFDKTKSVAVGAYEKSESALRKTFTDPLASFIVEETKGTSFGGETGLTLEKAKSNIRESTEFLISGKYPKVLARGGEIISGAGIGIVEDVRYKPGKQIAILAATVGIGYGASAITVGATSASTALFGARAGVYTGVGLKTAQIGAGVVLGGGFAIKTGTAIKAKVKEGDYLGAGSILGVASKDIGIGAYGFKSGQKLFSQTRGWWATRGRSELNIQQGDYPQAPTSKQLKMFQENVIKELGTKPGRPYYSDVFIRWKDNPASWTLNCQGFMVLHKYQDHSLRFLVVEIKETY